MSRKRIVLLFTFLGMLLFIFNGKTVQAGTVNDYIISNKIQPAQIQNHEGTFSVWTPYENGVGKPEGVVIHETADDHVSATAENEATYFNNNWNYIEAYVHAFVDNNEIINIHSTDYGVWGAGPTANAKYIQVELCHTHDYDSFARSIANDAYYTASKLIQYNLPDKPTVTILSHDQISKTYGETDHTDPVGYFNNWGYSMDQLYDMIGYYYNNLKDSGNVYGNNANSDLPTTNSANVINVNNTNGSYVPLVAFNNGVATKINNRALANKTAWYTDQTQDYNGVTYHRVATNEWVAANYGCTINRVD
ncbi:peptidoglycan recognition protein family protein, partial [Companilactobacillus crustorum]